ncbi:MAG: hypothetical protein LBC64_07495 [Fibromonadaceae bacterium]|jgi:predicted DNA-binding transcriptional regulator AlpA|nr:hypothetical protein [Fibromonadaceae bacterium]
MLLNTNDIEKIPAETMNKTIELVLSYSDILLTDYFNYFGSDEYYINEKEFMELIGLSTTKFYELKKQGCFKKAMYVHDGILKYHKYFDVFTNKIELPELITNIKNEKIPAEIMKILLPFLDNLFIKTIKMAFSLFDNLLIEHLNNAKYLDEYYITEKEFMELIGLNHTAFYRMKKLGRFEKAMHPASRGRLGVKYHKYFNRLTNKIELPNLLKEDIKMKKIPEEIMKIFLPFFDNLFNHVYKLTRDEYYITEKEFTKLIGLKKTRFSELKKQGKFKNIIRLTKSGRRVKYHKYFNLLTGKIELPGLDRPPIERQTGK